MGWYTVTKTIKGRKYLYLQMTYREGGKVKTKNKYLGPVSPTRSSFGAGAPPNLPVSATKAAPSPPKSQHRAQPSQKYGDWSSPFWDTPRTGGQLRKQAAVIQEEYQKVERQLAKRGFFSKYLSSNGRTERAKLAQIDEQRAFWQRKAASHFARELVFSKKGVTLKREK